MKKYRIQIVTTKFWTIVLKILFSKTVLSIYQKDIAPDVRYAKKCWSLDLREWLPLQYAATFRYLDKSYRTCYWSTEVVHFTATWKQLSYQLFSNNVLLKQFKANQRLTTTRRCARWHEDCQSVSNDSPCISMFVCRVISVSFRGDGRGGGIPRLTAYLWRWPSWYSCREWPAPRTPWQGPSYRASGRP